jgi:transcriptional antiterminator NusG
MTEENQPEVQPPAGEATPPAPAPSGAGPEPTPPVDSDRRWYVLQTYSGQEESVKNAIESNLELLNLKDKVFKVLVPEEEIVELKGSKRIEKKRKMFPGYVFLEMVLTDESWYAIRQTPGVARFIGTKVQPTPVSDREMQRVLKQIGVKEEQLEVAFERGESVRVISGPFRGYTGTVDEINSDKGKLKVLINIFGRDTPVEVNFEHAEKLT